jgi:hypothetical protein
VRRGRSGVLAPLSSLVLEIVAFSNAFAADSTAAIVELCTGVVTTVAISLALCFGVRIRESGSILGSIKPTYLETCWCDTE